MTTEGLFGEIDSLRSDVARLEEELGTVSGMLAKLCMLYENSNRLAPLRNTPLAEELDGPKLQSWWKDIKKSRAERQAREDSEAQRKRIARSALLKLSDAEKAALGIASGKRV